MADLFSSAPVPPLAELLRPKTLDEVVGQQHLLGPGRPLRLAFGSRRPHSFILWGPPGVGKTTLGRLAAKAVDAEFISLSAVTAGVKDIRAAVDAAQHLLDHRGRRTVLFIDEIHSFNKSQQDALLPHVESGLLSLVGGTTANPSFSLNDALLSRVQVYVLRSLELEDFRALHARAQPHLHGVEFPDEAVARLAAAADGDGRRFLNFLEASSSAAEAAGLRQVTAQFALDALGETLRRFDRDGDNTYDQISAFQKSIRGSCPDAALYWLARMLDGGMDALYIARRLVVIASEDVGNADPSALGLALNAAQAYERLGSPEGDRALAQATAYLAAAPKSNAVYTAWNEVRALVKNDSSRPVPMHLRNAPTALLKQLDHGKGYRYAHAEPGGYAAGETYLPEGVRGSPWYRPVDRGMEVRIGARLAMLKELDDQARGAPPAAR